MQVNTNVLHYHKPTNKFVGEASDFCSINQQMFDQLSPDAIDVGLTLVSEKTGEKADYYLAHTQYSECDNELQYWELLPTEKAIQDNPTLQGSSITIYND